MYQLISARAGRLRWANSPPGASWGPQEATKSALQVAKHILNHQNAENSGREHGSEDGCGHPVQILGPIDPQRGSGRRLEESVAFKHLLLSVLLLLALFLALSACVFQLSVLGIIFITSPRAVQGDDGLQLLSPAQSHTRGLGKCIPGGRYCSASIRKAEFAPKSTKRCWSITGHSCSGSGEVTLSAGDPFPKGISTQEFTASVCTRWAGGFFWGVLKVGVT